MVSYARIIMPPPTEIVRLIFSFLDEPSLRSASLANSLLRDVAQEIIFRDIKLEYCARRLSHFSGRRPPDVKFAVLENAVGQRFHQLLQSSPHIAPLVHSLTLRLGRDNAGSFVSRHSFPQSLTCILPALVSLRRLMVIARVYDQVKWAYLTYRAQAILQYAASLPSVICVKFLGIADIPLDIFQQRACALEQLAMSAPYMPLMVGNQWVLAPTHTIAKAFSLVNTNLNGDDLSFLYEPHCGQFFQDLTHLSLPSMNSATLYQILSECIRSIESLSLSLPVDMEVHGRACAATEVPMSQLPLRRFLNIQTLTINCIVDHFVHSFGEGLPCVCPGSWLKFALSSIPSASPLRIFIFSLEFACGPNYTIPRLDWAFLRTTFLNVNSKSRLQSLGEVRIKASVSDDTPLEYGGVSIPALPPDLRRALEEDEILRLFRTLNLLTIHS